MILFCRQQLENGTLVVGEVEGRRGSEARDEGSYQCVGSVEREEGAWTLVSRKARLAVSVLPRFVAQPQVCQYL